MLAGIGDQRLLRLLHLCLQVDKLFLQKIGRARRGVVLRLEIVVDIFLRQDIDDPRGRRRIRGTVEDLHNPGVFHRHHFQAAQNLVGRYLNLFVFRQRPGRNFLGLVAGNQIPERGQPGFFRLRLRVEFLVEAGRHGHPLRQAAAGDVLDLRLQEFLVIAVVVLAAGAEVLVGKHIR